MNKGQFSRDIFKAFKIRGLTLKADATEALLNVLSREDDFQGSLRLILDELKDRIEKQDITSTLIDLSTVQNIVADLSSNEDDVAQESVQLYDAFNCPKLHFDERNRGYKVLSSPAFKVLGDVDSRANMFRERLLITQQRLLRSDIFTLHGFGTNHQTRRNHDDGTPIHTIESLLGGEGEKVLVGMITQPEEGVWFLEDLTSTIRLDLSHTQYHHNVFYTEGSHVIVQGELVGDRFSVSSIALPPAELRDFTLKTLGITDTFGTDFRPQHMIQMQELEENASNFLVVILSEMHLDKAMVLTKFEKILEGFETSGVEPLYILMGSFFSKSYYLRNQGKQLMKSCFASLADIIGRYPRQRQYAKFLLVPGPLDAGSSVALPKKALPEEIAGVLRERVTHVAFASNPCRVRLFTQEIVLYREDLLKKMQKHLVFPLPTATDLAQDETEENEGSKLPDVTEQLVTSLLDQAHLCPLPMHARPVHWELDHSLRLFPLPHLLVLADRTEQFCYDKACHVVNPGMFASDFSFVVYQPSDRSVQYSRVPE